MMQRAKNELNDYTSASETIYTTSVLFFIAAITAVITEWARLEGVDLDNPAEEIVKLFPSWLRFVLGVDDLTDAYRTAPVCFEHIAFAIVAFFHNEEKGWRYLDMFGHSFGL